MWQRRDLVDRCTIGHPSQHPPIAGAEIPSLAETRALRIAADPQVVRAAALPGPAAHGRLGPTEPPLPGVQR